MADLENYRQIVKRILTEYYEIKLNHRRPRPHGILSPQHRTNYPKTVDLTRPDPLNHHLWTQWHWQKLTNQAIHRTNQA